MIRRRPSTWWWLFLLATTLPLRGADQHILQRAYELQAQGRMVESLASFQEFVSAHPAHIQASLDLAGLLSQMNRHVEAAQRLETIAQEHPEHETIQFKLAVERTALREFDKAEVLFRNLLESSNPDMVEAARDALDQLAKDRERQRRQAAEEKVYDLVRQFKNEEALEAVAALEAEQELSYPMALQRVYVLYNLGRFAEASEKAERLNAVHPRDTDLAFLRAELFMQLGSVAEANRLWKAIEEDHPGTFAADEAGRRRTATRPTAPQQNLEREVYELAEAKRYQDVIQAVDQMEIEAGAVPLNMEMQRLYALYNLNYFDVALVEAEKLAEQFPSAIDLSLLRAELLVKLERPEEATPIWERIEQEVPGSAAALEARRRMLALLPADVTAAKEQKIFDLAGEGKHHEVVDAVAALEAQNGSISMPMAMQRLYALYALEEFQAAWGYAGTLRENHPDDTALAFLAGEILVKLGRPEEANDIWQRIAEVHAGTPVGQQANDRLQANRQTEPASPEETRIYALAGERKYGEVISTVDALESSQGRVTHALAMQRLYALLATSQQDRALQEAESMAARPDAPPELALIQSEILIQRHHWEEASLILRDLKRKHAGEPLHEEANRRLSGIPQVANLDRLHWGEAYASGDYYGRFGALIGSGFVRYGTFVPKARRLQPHAEFKFVADTESETSGRPTIISDNHVGHYAGARLQLFKREYVFLYAQAGVNRDLLDQRDDGDYAFDYQAGIYGFKSWGPGVVLRQPVEEDFQFGDGGSDISQIQTNGFFWRGDWFADASLNFSYYHRYGSWIGYAGAREGFRLFQIGPRLGFDTYLVQNIAWDVKGNYFDNFFEVGPGVRWLWTPCPNAQVVLRAEWHYGAYLGRNEEQRGGAASSYDEIVAGLSVGMRW